MRVEKLRNLGVLIAVPLVSSFMFGGCSNEAATEELGAGGEGGAGIDSEGPAYLVMQTVGSPEGRQNYIYLMPSLDLGELDEAKGREFSESARVGVFQNQVYVADGESLSIKRFDVDADLRLVPSGDEMGLQQRGVSYIDSIGTFISEDRAYFMNSEQREVIVWSPRTMAITGSIDISSLADPSFPSFEIREGSIVGDKVFSNFYNSDWDASTADHAVTVAVFSTTENVLLDSLRDERCGAAWYGSLLPNGDFIVPGTSWGGSSQFFKPKPPRNCLLRIKKGTSTFDPDFVRDLDEITAPLRDGATFSYAAEAGGAIAWAHEPDDFADAEAYYTKSVWRPRIVDTETWTSTSTDKSLRVEGWFGDTFIVDGAAHFSLSPSAVEGGGSLVSYGEGGLKTRLTYNSGWLQHVQRIR